MRNQAELENMSRTQAEIIHRALKRVMDRVDEQLLRGGTWPWKGLMDGEQRLKLQRIRAVQKEIKEYSDEAQNKLLSDLERRAAALAAALMVAISAGSNLKSGKSEHLSEKEVKAVFQTPVEGKSLKVWIQRAFSNQSDRIRRMIAGIGKAGEAALTLLGTLRRKIVRFCKQVAKTLARTFLNVVSNRVNDKIFEIIGTEKVIYCGISDDRTCGKCLKQFGKIFYVKDPRRPVVPQHPNCRCWYEPYIE